MGRRNSFPRLQRRRAGRSGAYRVGGAAAIVFGAVMFLVGAYYLFKASGNPPNL